MNTSNIEKTLSELLLNTVDGVSEIDGKMLLSDQGVDSLDLNSFFLEVETHFKVTIDDESLTELDSIEKLAAFLRKKNEPIN